MTFHSRKLLLSAAITFALSSSAFAADEGQVPLSCQPGRTVRPLSWLPSGLLRWHRITIENVGYATGGPASLIALASGDVEIGSAATSAVLNSIIGSNDLSQPIRRTASTMRSNRFSTC